MWYQPMKLPLYSLLNDKIYDMIAIITIAIISTKFEVFQKKTMTYLESAWPPTLLISSHIP